MFILFEENEKKGRIAIRIDRKRGRIRRFDFNGADG